ncbi:uncharacterized protein [Rhodnius prolixus]|uniref:uncharacterized protein n=1 Tax=Rhodnius prolixus TaxID=13249 RepID=UPI003D18AA09
MVLEYCCFVIQLESGCLIIGYGGFIFVILNVLYLIYYGYTEEILNVIELIRIFLQILICILVIIASLLILIGAYREQTKYFAVWFGFAGSIVVTSVVSAAYLIFFEFYCLLPVMDIILGGVVIYCVFVTYSYYKQLSSIAGR